MNFSIEGKKCSLEFLILFFSKNGCIVVLTYTNLNRLEKSHRTNRLIFIE